MESRRQETDFRIPKIGIYTGRGASHSWLWFVEVFERLGFYDLSFLTEADVAGDALNKMDVLAVSGGDTFAIAKALGPVGATRLKTFITRGGLYLGSCAGAYLPLNSSKEHLNHFNFVPAKITNLTKTLPEAHGMKEKFCTCYGCSFIFHAVREAVEITTSGTPPFGIPSTFTAPLYGGPPMTVENPATVLAVYTGFTDKTLFLVDQKLAEKTLLGNAAVLRENMGHGHLHLFGPHFEHPHFTKANRYLANAMMHDLPHERVPFTYSADETEILEGSLKKGFIRDLKRELSNSRIVAAGLEMVPLKWTIGNKVYETGKIRVFLEALWQRIRVLEKGTFILVQKGQDDFLVETARHVTQHIRAIKKGWDQKTDTLKTATTLFGLLNKASALFLEIYFRSIIFHADSAKAAHVMTAGSFRENRI
ncbi:MAG: hypothetical protein K9N10_11110 [Deltaproteobacteria bacterium]|nr:hypothetical protein [Deltaproteobacteria bacterium]